MPVLSDEKIERMAKAGYTTAIRNCAAADFGAKAEGCTIEEYMKTHRWENQGEGLKAEWRITAREMWKAATQK